MSQKIKYERLTILYTQMEVCGKKKDRRAYCKCDCGNTTRQWLRHIKSGSTRSCGCFRQETTADHTTTHGKSKHPLYLVWNTMNNRCHLPTSSKYYRYGARGIKVCDEWRESFETFYQWSINTGWTKGLTLGRKNNNEGYSPTNCRWETQKEQQNNRSNNIKIEAFNETKTLSEWVADNRCVVPYSCLYSRIKLGWEPKTALITPSQQRTR
jgi:hypothetical protein